MIRQFIPASEAFDRLQQDPEFRKAYDALEGASALALTLIEARRRANLTQEQVAERIGTTQAAIARLEGGDLPSTVRLSVTPKRPVIVSASPWFRRSRRSGIVVPGGRYQMKV